MLSQGEAPRGQYDPCRNYDSRSSSPASSDHPRSQDSPAKTKPPPPPTALKPILTSRTSKGLNSPPVRDAETMEKSPEDPSKRSFMGKVKAFEQMDHVARTQRVLELQEAQNARVSYFAHNTNTSYTSFFFINMSTNRKYRKCVLNFIFALSGRDRSKTSRHLCRPNEISETGPQPATTYWVSLVSFSSRVRNGLSSNQCNLTLFLSYQLQCPTGAPDAQQAAIHREPPFRPRRGASG